MPHVTIYALCRSSSVLCRKGARADVTNADLPKPTDQMPIRIEKRCMYFFILVALLHGIKHTLYVCMYRAAAVFSTEDMELWMHAFNDANVYNKHTTAFMYENVCSYFCMYTCTSVFIKCEMRYGWLALGCIFPSHVRLSKVAAPCCQNLSRLVSLGASSLTKV